MRSLLRIRTSSLRRASKSSKSDSPTVLLVHSTQRITQRDKRVAHLHGRIRRDPAPAVNVTLKTRHQVVHCDDDGSKRLIYGLKSPSLADCAFRNCSLNRTVILLRSMSPKFMREFCVSQMDGLCLPCPNSMYRPAATFLVLLTAAARARLVATDLFALSRFRASRAMLQYRFEN